MSTPSIAGLSMSTSASSIPRQLPTLVTFRYQNQKKVVTLAASYQQAQVIAARSFPTLANVDSSWLQFSIAVRYRSTNERKEYPIQPESWYYVTSKLVAYRCIDVHVVPPQRSPEGTPSSFASSLLPDTPPRQHNAPLLFHQGPSNAPFYYSQLPRLDDDDDDHRHYSESPVTPPPKYPGSSSGYGYGFSWSPSPSVRPSPSLYPQPGTLSPYSTYADAGPGGGMDDVIDRRGRQHNPGAWSVNSVGFPASPARTHSQLSRTMSLSTRQPTAPPSPIYSHVPLPSSQPQGATGLRPLFSSIRRVFPGGSRSWASDSPSRLRAQPSARRQRRNSQPVRAPDSDYEDEEEYYSEVATRSGRSYVPSLI